jgi:hypothetical protein
MADSARRCLQRKVLVSAAQRHARREARLMTTSHTESCCSQTRQKPLPPDVQAAALSRWLS